MAFADPIVIGSQNFARTKVLGEYLATTSTMDQPRQLVLASDLLASKPSLLIRRKDAFNSVNPVVDANDRGLDVYIVVRSLSKDLSLFTGTSIQPLIGELNTFCSIANLDRMIRNEL